MIRKRCKNFTNEYQNLARHGQILLPDFKLRSHEPDLRERENLVRNELQTDFVDFTCTLHVRAFQLFVKGVVNPKIDITTPVALLLLAAKTVFHQTHKSKQTQQIIKSPQ